MTFKLISDANIGIIKIRKILDRITTGGELCV